jgi:hypothetical protein
VLKCKRKFRRLKVNISCAVFSLFDLLTCEDGTDRLSSNVGAEFPLYAAYRRGAQISHGNLAMQALVWLCVVQFRVIQFSTSYANLRQPSRILVPNFREKTSSCIQVNTIFKPFFSNFMSLILHSLASIQH